MGLWLLKAAWAKRYSFSDEQSKTVTPCTLGSCPKRYNVVVKSVSCYHLTSYLALLHGMRVSKQATSKGVALALASGSHF